MLEPVNVALIDPPPEPVVTEPAVADRLSYDLPPSTPSDAAPCACVLPKVHDPGLKSISPCRRTVPTLPNQWTVSTWPPRTHGSVKDVFVVLPDTDFPPMVPLTVKSTTSVEVSVAVGVADGLVELDGLGVVDTDVVAVGGAVVGELEGLLELEQPASAPAAVSATSAGHTVKFRMLIAHPRRGRVPIGRPSDKRYVRPIRCGSYCDVSNQTRTPSWERSAARPVRSSARTASWLHRGAAITTTIAR